jgi:hypothetical protein
MSDNLARRIDRLESIEAIKKLKAGMMPPPGNKQPDRAAGHSQHAIVAPGASKGETTPCVLVRQRGRDDTRSPQALRKRLDTALVATRSVQASPQRREATTTLVPSARRVEKADAATGLSAG